MFKSIVEILSYAKTLKMLVSTIEPNIKATSLAGTYGTKLFVHAHAVFDRTLPPSRKTNAAIKLNAVIIAFLPKTEKKRLNYIA